MKRYCIVSFCNIHILPYANIYIKEIVKNNCTCDLLFWDRDNDNGKKDKYEGCNNIVFQTTHNKISGYILATQYFNKVLLNNNYDGVIFLQSHVAVACNKVIQRKYKKRTVVDIRDYTMERNKLYYLVERSVIKSAAYTVISSPAYKRFLPKEGDYYLCHNYSPLSNEKKGKRNMPISISFVGTVRFFEMDKKVLACFANDDRFQINYYGRGASYLKEYCLQNNINNVDFFDSFPQEQTVKFYNNTSMINNLYGNHDPFLDYALSNKLYHAAQLRIPILVCPDTYMAEVVTKYNMGYVFDICDNGAKEGLFAWYSSFDYEKFCESCDSFLKLVKEENRRFYEMLDTFLHY